MTQSWRTLHNDKLHKMHVSPNDIRVTKSRRIIWVGHVAQVGEVRNAYNTFTGNSEGKISLRRPRHRWVDNIRMDLRDKGWMGVD